MTKQEALDKLDKLSNIAEVEKLIEEIYNDYDAEIEADNLGYIQYLPEFGRFKPNTKYRVYIEAWDE